MKHLSSFLSLALAGVSAHAAQLTVAPSPAPAKAPPATAKFEDAPARPQASKMKTCNADARTQNLHGPERRAFMKQCLSAK